MSDLLAHRLPASNDHIRARPLQGNRSTLDGKGTRNTPDGSITAKPLRKAESGGCCLPRVEGALDSLESPVGPRGKIFTMLSTFANACSASVFVMPRREPEGGQNTAWHASAIIPPFSVCKQRFPVPATISTLAATAVIFDRIRSNASSSLSLRPDRPSDKRFLPHNCPS